MKQISFISSEGVSPPPSRVDKAPSDFWLMARTILKLQQQSRQIQPLSRDSPLRLSHNQERLWFLEQLQPGSSIQNLQFQVYFNGSLQVEALHRSLNALAQRHEVLRTTYPAVDGHPTQAIAPTVAIPLPIVDLRNLAADEQAREVQQQAREDAEQAFDLEKGPLWRVSLLQLSDEQFMLRRTVHHIIFDAWSHAVFMRDLVALYSAFSTGQMPNLPALPVQYADCTHTQRQWLEEEALLPQLAYWTRQLGGEVPALELPIEFGRSPLSNAQGACQSFTLSPSLTQALKALSHQEGVVLYVTLLAVFNTLLHDYSRQTDMVLCSTVDGRYRAETRGLIGYFNNLVLLRTDLSGDPSFRELLHRVSQVFLEAYEHQDVPLQTIAELPNLVRTPLTRAMFVFHNAIHPEFELPDVKISSIHVDRDIANFELSLLMHEKAGQLVGALQYRTALFSGDRINQFLTDFQTMLEYLVSHPDVRLSNLPTLGLTVTSPAQDNSPLMASPSPKPYVAPRDDLERQVAALWETVLGIQPIGIQDTLFDLGVHSLLALRLSHDIEQTFGKVLPLTAIFQAPTVEQLSRILRDETGSVPDSCLAPIQPNGSKLPLFLCEGAGIYSPLIPYLGPDQPIYGLVMSGEACHQLEDLAAHYIREMKTLQPHGPYYLGGISWGGVIAFEMAQQLLAQGEEVALLAFLDTIRPGSDKVRSLKDRLLYHGTQLLKHKHRYVLDRLTRRAQKRRRLIRLQHNQVRQAFREACLAYQPRIYAGRLTIFRACDRLQQGIYETEPELGWGPLVSGGIDIYPIPGDHLGILQEPHVRVLGEQLSDCLRTLNQP